MAYLPSSNKPSSLLDISQNTTTKRAVPLDILRISAAIWVLVHHWISKDGLSRNLISPYDVSWIPNWIAAAASPGFLGVDIFFILSGIVISRSALDRSFATFVSARFLRLWPAYAAATTLAIILAPIWCLVLALLPSLQLSWLNFLAIADYGPYFALGILLGICRTKEDIRSDMSSLLVLLVLSLVRMVARLHGSPVPYHELVAIALIAIVLIATVLSNTMKFKDKPSFSTLALMSYPVYLFHEHLGMPAIGALVAQGMQPKNAFLVATLLLLLLCWLCVKYYEPTARKAPLFALFKNK